MSRRPRGLAGVRTFDKAAYMRDYMARRTQQRRTAIDKFKEVPCADCGQAYPPVCMDFDHVEDNKLFDVGRGKHRPWESIMAEIEKCEVVCANCHRLRTEARRQERKLYVPL